MAERKPDADPEQLHEAALTRIFDSNPVVVVEPPDEDADDGEDADR